ncbi:hypothetical protein GWI33_017152 [Rhynchophorus ferrugineus]|uniref:Uncharacterized protein n=1 Tax=Rhynchophorus ferrugineus TaxID=354439 RepID=A0A834HYM9_RHYFE|nr:hypothetical protein GWI33_017152 [Rhynchophorus ferrugineus]
MTRLSLRVTELMFNQCEAVPRHAHIKPDIRHVTTLELISIRRESVQNGAVPTLNGTSRRSAHQTTTPTRSAEISPHPRGPRVRPTNLLIGLLHNCCEAYSIILSLSLRIATLRSAERSASAWLQVPVPEGFSRPRVTGTPHGPPRPTTDRDKGDRRRFLSHGPEQ